MSFSRAQTDRLYPGQNWGRDVTQIIDTGVLGTRSAVLRRRGSELNFLIFPMMHVATPAFYAEVTRLLGGCAVVVVEGVTGRPASAGRSRCPTGSSRPRTADWITVVDW
jgi:hypothetical protein